MKQQAVLLVIAASLAAASNRIRTNRHHNALRAGARARIEVPGKEIYCSERPMKRVMEDTDNTQYAKVCWRVSDIRNPETEQNEPHTLLAMYTTADDYAGGDAAVLLDLGKSGNHIKPGSIDTSILSGTTKATCGKMDIHKYCIELQGIEMLDGGMQEADPTTVTLYYPYEMGGKADEKLNLMINFGVSSVKYGTWLTSGPGRDPDATATAVCNLLTPYCREESNQEGALYLYAVHMIHAKGQGDTDKLKKLAAGIAKRASSDDTNRCEIATNEIGQALLKKGITEEFDFGEDAGGIQRICSRMNSVFVDEVDGLCTINVNKDNRAALHDTCSDESAEGEVYALYSPSAGASVDASRLLKRDVEPRMILTYPFRPDPVCSQMQP